MNKILENSLLEQLETVSNLDLFDKKVHQLQENGGALPKNLSKLRQKAIDREIILVKTDILCSKDKESSQTRLNYLEKQKNVSG